MKKESAPDLSWLPPSLRGDPIKPILLACDNISTQIEDLQEAPGIVMISVAPANLIKARDYLRNGIDQGLELTGVRVHGEIDGVDADFENRVEGGDLHISKHDGVFCRFYDDATDVYFNMDLDDTFPVVEFEDKAYFGVSGFNGNNRILELYVLELKGKSPAVALNATSMDDIETILIEDAPSEVVKQLVEMGCEIGRLVPAP